ncbi:hypothetical protein ACWGNN_00620 [Streptomyces sp. NPDC055817]|uniref:hypothetical protein n=1 Tax=Streptomyces sp. NPDC056723 TaxID=3345925 RepID=UPI00368CF104
MSVRRLDSGLLVVDCDVCPESLDNADWVMHFDTAERANTVALDNGWTALPNGRHACINETPAHHQARAEATAT